MIDKTDADKKLGKTTVSAVAGIGGSWLLGSVGSQCGAMVGAAIGTAIFPGPGTAIGATIGSLSLGIFGSYQGSKLGKYIVDITATE